MHIMYSLTLLTIIDTTTTINKMYNDEKYSMLRLTAEALVVVRQLTETDQ